MSDGPFRLIHISDLHICHPDLKDQVELLRDSINDFLLEVSDNPFLGDTSSREFFKDIINRKEFKLEVGAHDENKLRRLVTCVKQQDPQLVCITGDITTFGDPLSFDLAKRLVIDQLSSDKCHILIVPGNHDLLLNRYMGEMRTLIRRSLSPISKMISIFLKLKKEGRTILRKVKSLQSRAADINGIMKSIDIVIDRSDGKDSIRTFDNLCSNMNQNDNSYLFKHKDHNNEYLVNVYLLDSTSNNWVLMNRGEWENKIDHVINNWNGVPEVRIVMLHHHPLSSTKLTEGIFVSAYNGMEGAEQFLYQLEERGINLVLHGHQHKESLYRMDFQLNNYGHIYVAGVPAAALEGIEDCGFNVYEFFNEQSATVYCWKDDSGSYKKQYETNLIFDPREVSVKMGDIIARHARREIQFYRYKHRATDAGRKWDEISDNGGNVIYHFGVDHKGLIDNDRFDTYSRLLMNVNDEPRLRELRILINDTELFEAAIKYSSSQNGCDPRSGNLTGINLRSLITDLWGKERTLPSLISDIETTIEEFMAFKDKIIIMEDKRISEEELKDKVPEPSVRNFLAMVTLKETLSLIPYCAAIRDPDQSNATMVIKLMPYGALYRDDNVSKVSQPLMQLDKRRDEYIFSYYWDHLETIWNNTANRILYSERQIALIIGEIELWKTLNTLYMNYGISRRTYDEWMALIQKTVIFIRNKEADETVKEDLDRMCRMNKTSYNRWKALIHDIEKIISEGEAGATVRGLCETYRISKATYHKWKAFYQVIN